MAVEIGTVFKLRQPPEDPSYPYSTVEATGSFDLGERGVEVVLTPLGAFAPVLVVAEDQLYAAGYLPDQAATDERRQAKADNAAKRTAAADAKHPPAPWELAEANR